MDVLFRWILYDTDDGNGDVDDYNYVNDTNDINLRDRNAEEKKEEAKRLEEVSEGFNWNLNYIDFMAPYNCLYINIKSSETYSSIGNWKTQATASKSKGHTSEEWGEYEVTKMHRVDVWEFLIDNFIAKIFGQSQVIFGK